MNAGTGIDRETGQVISGWPHVSQSLQVIFTTKFGDRVMRRWFGSFVPLLLGRNMTQSTVMRFWMAICIAIEHWEPRFKIIKIVPFGSEEQMRSGALGFKLTGIYYPRGHLGDFTPDGTRDMFVGGLVGQTDLIVHG